MFRFNIWSRPYQTSSSGNGQIDGPCSGYLPVPLQATPALMVLASSAADSAAAVASLAGRECSSLQQQQQQQHSVCHTPTAAHSGRSSGGSSSDKESSMKHHAAFGHQYPLFRQSHENAFMPNLFSHMHQSFLRAHLDPAALHQAGLDPRRVGALLGYPPSGGAGYPSAFQPARKMSKYDEMLMQARSDSADAERASLHSLKQQQHHHHQSPRSSRDLHRPHSGGKGGNRSSPTSPALVIQGDDRRYYSPAPSYADSDVLSDNASPADRNSPTTAEDKISSPSKGRNWMLSGDEGRNEVRCPVCRQSLSPVDLQLHLMKELADLRIMSVNQAVSMKESSSTSCKESSGSYSGMSMSTACYSSKSHQSGGCREMTSKSRYETFNRVRNNRETRLAKIRNRRKRSHDQLTTTCSGHSDDMVTNGSGQCDQSLRSDNQEDETIDVISLEDQNKENDWLTSTTEPGILQKETADKSTRTDDGFLATNNTNNNNNCTICKQPYTQPTISIQCWHVFCEHCWFQRLSTSSTCPQCDVTTSLADLKKIFI